MPDTGFDINRYAVALELSLDTGSASRSLGELEKTMEQLEQRVSIAAQQALGSFNTLTAKIVAQTTDLGTQFQKIGKSISSHIPKLKTEHDLGEKQLKQTAEIYNTLVKTRKEHKQIQDTLAKTRKLLPDDMKGFTDQLETLVKIKEAIDKKNLGHEEQIKLVEKTTKSLDDAGLATDTLSSNVGNSTAKFEKLWGAAQNVWSLLKVGINPETERFHTINYRLLGTMNQMIGQVNNIAGETGASYEVILDSMQALADLQMPKDEMEKYTKLVTMANRVTGLGTQQLAGFAKQLQSVGYTSASAERSITYLSEVQRKFRLSTEDMNRLMSHSTKSAKTWAATLGDPKAYEKLKAMQAGFAGLLIGDLFKEDAKLVGAANEETEKLISNNLIGLDAMGTALGREIKTVEDHQAGLLAFMRKFHQEHGAMWDGSMNRDEYLVQLKVLHRLYPELSEDTLRMYDEMGKAQDAGTDLGAIMRQLGMEAKASAAAAGTMAEQYNETTSSAQGAFNRMLQQFNNIGRNIQNMIDGPLAAFYTSLGWIAGLLQGKFAAAVVLVGIVLSRLGFGVVGLVGRLLGLGRVAAVVGSAFPAMGGLFSGAIAMMGTALTGFIGLLRGAVVLVGQLLIGIAGTAARIMVILGQGLATAITAIGTAATRSAVGLLALGGALLMAGGGAYLLARGAALLADKGWAGVGALTALSLAVGLVAGALVLLAPAALAAAPGLLTLGAALLMAGGAAALFGKGVDWIGNGLLKTVNALQQFVDLIVQAGNHMDVFAANAPKFGKAVAEMLYEIGVNGALRLAALTPSLVALGLASKDLAAGFKSVFETLKQYGNQTEGLVKSLKTLMAVVSEMAAGKLQQAASGMKAFGAAFVVFANSFSSVGTGVVDRMVQALGRLVAQLTPVRDLTNGINVALGGLVAILSPIVTVINMLADSAQRLVGTLVPLKAGTAAIPAIVASLLLFGSAEMTASAATLDKTSTSLVTIANSLNTLNSSLNQIESNAGATPALMTSLAALDGPELAAAGAKLTVLSQAADTAAQAMVGSGLTTNIDHITKSLRELNAAADESAAKLNRLSSNASAVQAQTRTDIAASGRSAEQATKFAAEAQTDLKTAALVLQTGIVALGDSVSQLDRSRSAIDNVADRFNNLVNQLAGKSIKEGTANISSAATEVLRLGNSSNQLAAANLPAVLDNASSSALKLGDSARTGARATASSHQQVIKSAQAAATALQQLQRTQTDSNQQQTAALNMQRTAAGAAATAVATTAATTRQTATQLAAANLQQTESANLAVLAQQAVQRATLDSARATQTAASRTMAATAAAVQAHQQNAAAIKHLRQLGADADRALQPSTMLDRRQEQVQAALRATRQERKAMAAQNDIVNLVDQQAAAGMLALAKHNRSAAIMMRNDYMRMRSISVEHAQAQADTISLMVKKMESVSIEQPALQQVDKVRAINDHMMEMARDSAQDIVTQVDTITNAVTKKAIPALQKSRSKVNDTIRAETISTVQIKDQERRTNTTSEAAMMAEQNKLLKSIISILSNHNSGEDVKAIAGLLQLHLPKLKGNGDTNLGGGLSSEMNNWGM